jgi:hypothetical protein
MDNLKLFDVLLKSAMLLYDEVEVHPPEQYAIQLMDTQGLPMHCPEHHFIVPAALLLAAHRRVGTARDKVKQDLHTAMIRGQTIPGGFCGNCGCCGAAVGAGMFLSIWLATNPKSTENWALVQRMTACALEEIAAVEGPRCCKRVTFLALEAARIFCKTELALNLGGKQEIVCKFFSNNEECRHTACPFFPRPD